MVPNKCKKISANPLLGFKRSSINIRGRDWKGNPSCSYATQNHDGMKHQQVIHHMNHMSLFMEIKVNKLLLILLDGGKHRNIIANIPYDDWSREFFNDHSIWVIGILG